MIVRRLCVTPAVGSLMQWLLTKRNRTAEAYKRRIDTSTTRSLPLRSFEHVPGSCSERAEGKNAAVDGWTAEAHQGGRAGRSASSAGVGGCDSGVGADR